MQKPDIKEIFGLERMPAPKEIGIEVEMEGEGLRFYPQYWRTENDGSLRGTSAEYVLRTPCARGLVKSRIGSLLKAAEANDAVFKPSARCGVHIHINAQSLVPDQVLNWIVAYMTVEDLLNNWCGEHRQHNLFCLPTSDASGMLPGLVEAMETGRLNPLFKLNNMRYGSVNLMSLRKFGTLEFRCMQTPEDLNDIVKWVRLLLAVKDYGIGLKRPADMIEDASIKGTLPFLESVLGEEAPTLMQNVNPDDVEELLSLGMRNAQMVAYHYDMRPPIKHTDQTSEAPKKKVRQDEDQVPLRIQDILPQEGEEAADLAHMAAALDIWGEIRNAIDQRIFTRPVTETMNKWVNTPRARDDLAALYQSIVDAGFSMVLQMKRLAKFQHKYAPGHTIVGAREDFKARLAQMQTYVAAGLLSSEEVNDEIMHYISRNMFRVAFGRFEEDLQIGPQNWPAFIYYEGEM